VFESPELIGDIRCFDTNNAAGSSVFIHVDNPDGSEQISIRNQDPNRAVDNIIAISILYCNSNIILQY
jgi:hypothetical protein